jgi:hypothetical protein
MEKLTHWRNKMIKVNTISNAAAYNALRLQVIYLTEGGKTYAYGDSVGDATIGIGFDLRDTGVFTKVIDSLAPAMTSAQRNLLEVVVNRNYPSGNTKGNAAMLAINAEMAILHKQNNAIPSTLTFADTSQMESIYEKIVITYENRVDSWLGTTIADSLERVALVSLSYNGGLGPSLHDDIIDGNRAEAWYEIRYRSNGTTGVDLSNRRYLEASKFDLYYDINNVSLLDAEQVAMMYTANRTAILTYEKSHSPLAADKNYAISYINDIYIELKPAINEFKIFYGISSSVDIKEVQIACNALDKNNTKHYVIENLTGANDNQLLIGDSNSNKLNSVSGNDVLIGNGGNDVFMCGTGNNIVICGGGFSDSHNTLGLGTGNNIVKLVQAHNNVDGSLTLYKSIDTFNNINSKDTIDLSGLGISTGQMITTGISVTGDANFSELFLVAPSAEITFQSTVGGIYVSGMFGLPGFWIYPEPSLPFVNQTKNFEVVDVVNDPFGGVVIPIITLVGNININNFFWHP